MAGRRLTTTDLLAEVRSLLDEYNTEQVRDEQDILPALNRAQDAAANVLARHYEEPLLTSTTLTLTSEDAQRGTFPIPENAFEQRLEKVELFQNQVYLEIPRISYRDATDYDFPMGSSLPSFYAVMGQDIRLYPQTSAGTKLRLWYLRDPEPLVLVQGRITSVDGPNRRLVLDSIGSSLTTEEDQLNSYITVTDGETGLVKGRYQVQSIVDRRLTLRSAPKRTTVLEKEILSEIDALVIKPDDIVTTIHGVGVPFLKKPLANFLISYAVADLKVNKLGGDATLIAQQVQMFSEQVERMWVGREQTRRVKKVNRHLGSRLRRDAKYLYNK